MRIGIVYSSDPVFMDPFIYEILKNYRKNIVCVLLTKGSIVKKRNVLQTGKYFLSLLIIMGLKDTAKMLTCIIKSRFTKNNYIYDFAVKHSINHKTTDSINSKDSVEWLYKQNLDVVFNQSQHIVHQEVLEIPKIGVINRHGAYLPGYRGRLAPFWQLYDKEKVGGLTYHFINREIDDGPIILQERIEINDDETLLSLIDKVFSLGVIRFSEVIDILSRKNYKDFLKENSKKDATYYSSPGILDALKYRLQRRM